MTFQEIAQKKIAGVPVIYLAGAAVAILAVVAWKMKPSPEELPPDAALSEDAQLDDQGHADGYSPYAGAATNGTITVVQTPPVPEVEPDRIDTNDEWVREGAEWLVAEKNVSGAAAYTALIKYVGGRSRSFTESQWADWVIKEKGLPPDPITETPAASQPTPAAPAKPVATGYRGYGWVKANGKTSGAQYAAKYKIPASQFYSWNSGQPRVPRKGTWLKVRNTSNPLTGYKGV